MPEIKYTILNDDGDNFEYEKAIVENEKTSRSQIASYEQKIKDLEEKIAKDKAELVAAKEQLAELKKVEQIADEKKAQEQAELEAQNENVGE